MLSRELGLCLHWKGKYYLKDSARPSQATMAGLWVSLEELLVRGAAGHRAQILKQLDASQAPASHRFLGMSQSVDLAPLKSVGVLLFVALLQITLMRAPGTELLEQHLGNDCKQHPNNLCKRICSLGSAPL